MKPARKPFSTVMDAKLRRQLHTRCADQGYKIYVVVETALREWLDKTGPVERG